MRGWGWLPWTVLDYFILPSSLPPDLFKKKIPSHVSDFLAQGTFPFMLYWVCVPHFFKRQVFLSQTESKFMAILHKAVFRYPNSLALEKLELYLPQASSCFSRTSQYFGMVLFMFIFIYLFFWLIRKQSFWLLSAKIINGLSCGNGKYDYDTENYVNGPAHTRPNTLE